MSAGAARGQRDRSLLDRARTTRGLVCAARAEPPAADLAVLEAGQPMAPRAAWLSVLSGDTTGMQVFLSTLAGRGAGRAGGDRRGEGS